MKFLELNKEESKKIFEYFIENNGIPTDYFESLSLEELKLRKDLLALIDFPLTKTYDFDLKFGIKLHEYFNVKKIEEFNEAIASNYDFWRYLSLKIIPDVIMERHGLIKEYFYDKNVRIYPSTIWWYIEFGFQLDYLNTYNSLKKLSTDYILNIVERPGREGLYIDAIRLIIKYICLLPEEIINKKEGKSILLRRVMIQNTARINNYNLIIENKTNEYVRSLFENCGVEVNEYEFFN